MTTQEWRGSRGRHRLVVWVAAWLAFTTSAGAAASDCKLAQVADWQVRPGRGVPIVDGAINGQKVGVMLDTGSSTLMLRSAAKRLGLQPTDVRGARVFGIGGETSVEWVSVMNSR
jgi:aspartyl protease